MLEPQSRQAHLSARVIATDIFSGLPPSVLQALEADLSPVRLAAGETLFRQGEPGDSLYILVQGRLAIAMTHSDGNEQIVDELTPGMSVGEMALLTGHARSATVRAIEDAELARFSRDAFERLAEQNPAFMLQFAATILPRLQRTQLAGILASLFGELSMSALHELQAELSWQHLTSGQALFRQGDPGDALYIVLCGRLQLVIRAPHGGENIVGEIGPGECVGEFALLTGEQRTATALAIRDTELVRLPQAAFERLIAQYPHAMNQIARTIVRRQQRLEKRPQRAARLSFAVIALGADVPLSDFARALASTLDTSGATLFLDSVACDDLVGKPGVAQTRAEDPTSLALVGWLNDLETHYQYIVYQGDSEWTPWTARCIRQADRILLVGRADDSPALTRIEEYLGKMQVRARQELVLLHPLSCVRPSGTRHWLAPRSVHHHFHVRPALEADMHRLARCLTGRGLGLVLGGGGARGLAHIGVLRALDERGIPVDFAGGTSMGAFVSAVYVLGLSRAEILKFAERFGSPHQYLDYTLPIVSFLASKKITAMLQSLFGDVRIEDLWHPYFCVSSNLTRARVVVHRTGLLWRTIRSSLAIPGIFSLVLDEGDLLVDGAILDNLPVGTMRELVEGGPVVAVDVNVQGQPAEPYSFDMSVSGWRVLWSRLNPWAKPLQVPSILAMLTQSTLLGSVAQQHSIHEIADLLIVPPVARFSMMDYRPVGSLVDAGYRAAQSALNTWQYDRE